MALSLPISMQQSLLILCLLAIGGAVAVATTTTDGAISPPSFLASFNNDANKRKKVRFHLSPWVTRFLGSRGGNDEEEEEAAIISKKEEHDPFKGITREEMKQIREKHMFSRLTLFYKDDPLCLVRGEGQYIFDDQGKRYLDCVNNVAHIGHAHPAVVEAAAQQLSLINSNTRYHAPGRSRYAKKLLACFPPELDTVFFVNSGSEANDLALALARAYTKHEDAVVLDYAYHGHTTTMIDLSAYKHRGHEDDDEFPKEWVHVVPTPDSYRGQFTGSDAGPKYAQVLKDKVLDAVENKGRTIAAFFAEGVLACGGQVVLPPHYLQHAYAAIRGVGGLCVADEVQTGFGRSGTHFWAFETQGVVPDIITTGKPIGNGFPLSAVITRKEIAESLPMDYFNTFGGNGLAMAIGEAVLDVVVGENLQGKALDVGTYVRSKLDDLAKKHPLIGDVRGLGMMFGIELVLDREIKTPAPEAASYVLNKAREWGVHIQVDGIWNNCLKFKPPLCFTWANADTLVEVIDKAITEWTTMNPSSIAIAIPSKGPTVVTTTTEKADKDAAATISKSSPQASTTTGQQGSSPLSHKEKRKNKQKAAAAAAGGKKGGEGAAVINSEEEEEGNEREAEGAGRKIPSPPPSSSSVGTVASRRRNSGPVPA